MDILGTKHGTKHVGMILSARLRRYVGPRSRQRGHWKSDTRSTKPLEETYTKADKSLELHLSSKAFNNIVTKYHFRSLSFECINFIHVFRTESKVTKLV